MGATLKRSNTRRAKRDAGVSRATYAYCIVHARRRPSIRAVVRGVPGSEAVRVLEVDRFLHLVVSSVPADEYGEAAIARGLKDLTWVSACAVGHERVVERFLDRGTVVPMKLFTIFTSDERAVEHVARERATIDDLVERLAGRVEMGVRVTLTAKRGSGVRADRAESGAAYLRAKQALREQSIELSRHAQDKVEHAFETLAAAATESLRRPVVDASAGGGRVLLDAAYLVPSRREKRFRSAVRTLARMLSAEGYEVNVTGPWPPYNFIGARP
jgi:Gas vesicle synthesis protein GvpL/GvpF